VIVVDASVLGPALSDDGAAGERARDRLKGERIAAPELIDLEVVSIIRKAHSAGYLSDHRAALALADLTEIEMDRVSHVGLLARVWELRGNVTPYDAAYVALAETIGAPLLTADAALSRAPGTRCHFELLRTTA
jgi:predicted nucleic acid-binding protein